MKDKLLLDLQKYSYMIIKDVNSIEEYYYQMNQEIFLSLLDQLKENRFELLSLVCIENFNDKQGISLLYFFEVEGYQNLFSIIVPINKNSMVSIGMHYPSASWYEREIKDGFGITFLNAFDDRGLLLHEIFYDNFHPLRKEFINSPIETKTSIKKEDEYKFNTITGEGIYQIPVGPVHAGIIEPGHFRFSVIGETIFNLEIRLFYKHRGIEKLAEGKNPLEILKIAESISGDETVANVIGYCMAVEKIAKIKVPNRGWQLRTILLELERIYSFLSDLAGMIVDVAYPTGASDFFIMREEIFQWNHELTRSRFMKGIVTIGGLERDISDSILLKLKEYLLDLSKKFEKSIKRVLSLTTVIDRFVTTGIVKEHLIIPLHLTGPVARSVNNLKIDERKKHPYGYYKNMEFELVSDSDGDVMARFNVKQKEVVESTKKIIYLIENLQEGPIKGNMTTIEDGFASSIVESARGQNFSFIYIKNGKIDRYKVRTASFCNWQAIQHAVLGNIVPDFPLINKSFNLSYAGTDL